MGLKTAFKIKYLINRYGLVKYSDNRDLFCTRIAFEKDLGGNVSDSDRLMFVKDNILFGLFPLGYKVVEYLEENLISSFEQQDTTTLVMSLKNEKKITIEFSSNDEILLFLKELQDIQDNKSDIIKEIENEK